MPPRKPATPPTSKPKAAVAKPKNDAVPLNESIVETHAEMWQQLEDAATKQIEDVTEALNQVLAKLPTDPPPDFPLTLDHPPSAMAHMRRAQQKPAITRANQLWRAGVDAAEALRRAIEGT